ncbi:hypothetical protein ACMX2H_16070 [Arthrobacter sulfonylureivorans]|uniref:hypothetical protein n=1 Tax=Arthrobacter sulfonylureivorans TaxID=2486855 RepID=UPI0039E25A1C
MNATKLNTKRQQLLRSEDVRRVRQTAAGAAVLSLVLAELPLGYTVRHRLMASDTELFFDLYEPQLGKGDGWALTSMAYPESMPAHTMATAILNQCAFTIEQRGNVG